MSDIITKVENDDPSRCQFIATNGQCNNKAVEGGTVCFAHGGNNQERALQTQANRMYKLERYKRQFEDKLTHPGVKTLCEEIGLLRMNLQETLAKAEEQEDLLLFQPQISALVSDITSTIIASQKLEASLGMHMNKTQIVAHATGIISVIARHIDDANVMSAITVEIAALFAEETD